MSDPRDEMRKLSRRSLLWAGAALIGSYGGFRFLSSRRPIDGTGWLFRRALEVNESVWSDAYSQSAMAPTFDPSQRTNARVNGDEGLIRDFDPAQWSLAVDNVQGATEPFVLTLDEIKRMPRHEMTTQLCCIEGWSMIVTWAGVPFREFARRFSPGGAAYVYMATPGEGYYVGLDMQSALHPQTLLCYEMNGQPLTPEHGAPLRLVIPRKYGIKNIKRLTLIRYTDTKPPDFWAERGYDWYAGL